MGNENTLASRVADSAAGVRSFRDAISGTFAEAGWTPVGAAAYAEHPRRYERVEKIFMRGVPYEDAHGNDRISECGFILKRGDGRIKGRIEAETLSNGEYGSAVLNEMIRNAKYRYPESEIVFVLDADDGLLSFARERAGDPEFSDGGKRLVVLAPDEFRKWFFENLE